MKGQRDLADLALVSRSWLYHVRRELYKHPKLHTFRSCTLITTTLSDNPDFVSFLRAIDIAPQTNIHSSSQRMKEKRRILTLMRCLVPFEGLGSTQLQIQLELGFTCAETMIPTHIGLLLTSLTLVSDHSEGVTMINWAIISERCPNLKRISLESVYIKVPTSSAIMPCNIEKLKVDSSTIVNGSKNMQYLLYGRWHILRTLEISNTSSASSFLLEAAEILRECTGLEALKLTKFEYLEYPLVDALFNAELDPISSLRTLHLGNFEVRDAAHIIRCCPNVEVVILEGSLKIMTYMLWQEVKGCGKMKKLRKVEILDDGKRRRRAIIPRFSYS
ncbi:hypothetical protein C8Q75DRAFT_736209 [Abortiporus biennis]|nr:hypothetical protein C8Q75DRAFT_736209 [Abortiporus biennis]